jgi:hypothetical protein
MPTGKTVSPRPSLRCHTRALKNARHLKRYAPELFSADPDREGFGTGVSVELLRGLHRIHSDSPVLRRHKAVADVLRAHPLPKPRPPARDALFNGTIHFAQITFTTSGGDKVMATADMQQIVAYAKHAIVPIMEYAALYGPNSSTISPHCSRRPSRSPDRASMTEICRAGLTS